MGKLTEQQRTTLKLIARSAADEKGWVQAADEIYAQLIVPMPTSLCEKDSGQLRVRLTPEALILLKWM